MSNATLEHVEDAVLHLAEAFSGVQKDEERETIHHLTLAREKITDAMNSYRDYLKKKNP